VPSIKARSKGAGKQSSSTEFRDSYSNCNDIGVRSFILPDLGCRLAAQALGHYVSSTRRNLPLARSTRA
jgi:hypothetical protein